MSAPSRHGGFDRRKLNPAFASAHGLSTTDRPAFRDTALSAADAADDAAAPASSTRSAVGAAPRGGRGRGGGGRRPAATAASNPKTAPATGRKRVEHALKAARSTGRLNLSDCGLTAPLPEEVFDLRKGVSVDVSLDRDDSDVNPWEAKGEEEVTLVDFSDNDGLGSGGDEDDSGGGGELDGRIERFVAVRTLRCRRCRLKSIPWMAVGTMDHLTLLDLAGNGLTSVPLHFLPIGLRELDLSSNKIISLSRFEEALGCDGESRADGSSAEEPEIVLPHLIRLDVTDNQLESFPELLRLGSLQTLRFGKNRISGLSDGLIAQCSRSLSSLEGPENKIDASPNFSACRGLRVLDLCDNDLQDVPTIHQSLVRLALSNNNITSTSSLFGVEAAKSSGSEPFRSQLSELRLRRNKLAALDGDVLGYLTNLALLDLGENELRDLPPVIGYLPQLRRVPLDRNPLRIIRISVAEDTEALKKLLRKRGSPPEGPGYVQAEGGRGGDPNFRSEVEGADAKSVVNESMVGSHTLDLSNKELSDLPTQIIAELRSTASAAPFEDGPATVGGQVRGLKLSHNSLTALKEEWFAALPNITRLDAGHNRIDSLPANLGDVPLAAAELKRNALASEAIASSALCRSAEASRLARHLTHLDLSCNRLEWTPRGLFDLPRLSTLILSNNRIQSLTRSDEGGGRGWYPGLPALENLDLSDNRIGDLGDLPAVLSGCCPKLRTLTLSNNDLRSIPPTLGLVQTLNSIDLRGNPQRSIRPAVLDRSCGAILSYLRSRLDAAELRAAERMQLEFSKQVVGRIVDAVEEEKGEDGGERLAGSSCSKPEAGGAERSRPSSKVNTSSLAEELRSEVSTLTIQLNNVYLTEAKKYAMKKTLAMKKAKLIREERRLKTESG